MNTIKYNPYEDGLSFNDAKKVLEELGINAELKTFSEKANWGELPDLAIVCVKPAQNQYHAVVFIRTSSGSVIFDANMPTPQSPGNYTLSNEHNYLAIPH